MLDLVASVLAAPAWDDPRLTFTLALSAGVVAQALAHHLRLPGIVVFLSMGVLLGPDVANLVRPNTLGSGLDTLIGLAVAVILFEGGLNLNIGRLRRQATTIRRLVTIGVLITAFGGAVAARFIMGWSWELALLFGTLVVVTGPTVIQPLLRRIRVIPRVRTVLEAEAVLIDPIGAILAVVTLEVLLSTTAESAAMELLGLPSRLVVGALLGAAGGFAIGFVLRWEGIVPDEIRNVFTLALVLALFGVSEAILPETGVLAAPVAGIVVGNMRTRVYDELMEFKEELTIMLVAMLFVLLAADVRVDEAVQLGWPAIATIGLLMFVVRPADVAVCTAGSDLSLRERAFIGWLGPRGIVAAAIASLFAQELENAGMAGGDALRALVFLLIAITVLVQGLSGGALASWLGVRRRSSLGYAIVGANPLGRALARALTQAGHEAVLIDSNAQETTAAKEAGFNVVFGNANEERTLLRADIEGRRGVITVTGNEGANFLIGNRVRQMTRGPQTLVCVARGKAGVQAPHVRDAGHSVLFGRPIEIDHWMHALRAGVAEVQPWRFTGEDEDDAAEIISGRERTDAQVLGLVVSRKRGVAPIDDRTTVRQDDVVRFVVLKDQIDNVRRRLTAAGWERAGDAESAPAPEAGAHSAPLPS